MDLKLDEQVLQQINDAAAADEEAQEQAQAGEVATISNAQKWATIPRVLGSVLCMALPELKQAYTEENCQGWGEAMDAMAQKHGWSPDAAVGPELGVVVASLPLAVPTVLVVMQRRKAAMQARAEAAVAEAAHAAKSAPPDMAQVLNPAPPPVKPEPESPAVKLEAAGVFGV